MTNPPTLERPSKAVIDPHAVAYSSIQPSIVADDAHRTTIAKQMLGLLRTRYGDRLASFQVLDVGASGGQITAAVGDAVTSIIGIDPDPEAIAHAVQQFSAPGKVGFEVGDGEQLRFPDNSFDLVLCNQVYEFVRSDEAMMREIYRVLKPGGECLLGARNKWAIIEAQYHLPFLSWLPSALQTPYVRLAKRGEVYHGRYRGYGELRQLVRAFELTDYTIKILRDPKAHGFDRYAKYQSLARLLPLEWFVALIPNYLWFLRKPDTNA